MSAAMGIFNYLRNRRGDGAEQPEAAGQNVRAVKLPGGELVVVVDDPGPAATVTERAQPPERRSRRPRRR